MHVGECSSKSEQSEQRGTYFVPLTLAEYTVQSITEGIDALGEVSVRISCDEQQFSGYGADTDIIVASAKAYLAAINRAVAGGAQDRPQPAPILSSTG